MKAILIIGIILALMIICGVICCLCAADGDELKEWGDDDDEQDR